VARLLILLGQNSARSKERGARLRRWTRAVQRDACEDGKKRREEGERASRARPFAQSVDACAVRPASPNSGLREESKAQAVACAASL
jgi:hypothetical protein